jgi:hypothetical protein
MIKMPVGKLVGGGIVTEIPFPPNGTAGAVSNIAAMMNGSSTMLTAKPDASTPLVKRSSGAGEGMGSGRATGASVAALVLMVAAAAMV